MADPRFRWAAGSVSSLGLQPLWCTKYRRRLLGGRVAVRFSELLDDIAVEKGWDIVAREVIPDHVHIFVRVPPTDSPAAVARRFKDRTRRVLRAEFPWLGRRPVLWSKPYFAASVGYVSEQTVRRYIEHHWDAA